ncbi:MAG: 30S ribosomal protein S17 [Mycoplasmataceae bacterium]|jgi:small subunit ribosomal protein S17|nr:30S ribosomal protein S17 [Mycoplasmataceae bacterium]
METIKSNKTRRVFVGEVISTKMNKTIVVEVERKGLHPLYHKLVISHKKYHVHDEENKAQVGDIVEIMETRPLSKTKFYRLVKIRQKAE